MIAGTTFTVIRFAGESTYQKLLKMGRAPSMQRVRGTEPSRPAAKPTRSHTPAPVQSTAVQGAKRPRGRNTEQQAPAGGSTKSSKRRYANNLGRRLTNAKRKKAYATPNTTSGHANTGSPSRRKRPIPVAATASKRYPILRSRSSHHPNLSRVAALGLSALASSIPITPLQIELPPQGPVATQPASIDSSAISTVMNKAQGVIAAARQSSCGKAEQAREGIPALKEALATLRQQRKALQAERDKHLKDSNEFKAKQKEINRLNPSLKAAQTAYLKAKTKANAIANQSGLDQLARFFDVSGVPGELHTQQWQRDPKLATSVAKLAKKTALDLTDLHDLKNQTLHSDVVLAPSSYDGQGRLVGSHKRPFGEVLALMAFPHQVAEVLETAAKSRQAHAAELQKNIEATQTEIAGLRSRNAHPFEIKQAEQHQRRLERTRARAIDKDKQIASLNTAIQQQITWGALSATQLIKTPALAQLALKAMDPESSDDLQLDMLHQLVRRTTPTQPPQPKPLAVQARVTARKEKSQRETQEKETRALVRQCLTLARHYTSPTLSTERLFVSLRHPADLKLAEHPEAVKVLSEQLDVETQKLSSLEALAPTRGREAKQQALFEQQLAATHRAVTGLHIILAPITQPNDKTLDQAKDHLRALQAHLGLLHKTKGIGPKHIRNAELRIQQQQALIEYLKEHYWRTT